MVLVENVETVCGNEVVGVSSAVNEAVCCIFDDEAEMLRYEGVGDAGADEAGEGDNVARVTVRNFVVET